MPPQSSERSAAQIVSFLRGEGGMVRVGPSLEYSLQQIAGLISGVGAASTWQRSGPSIFVAARDASNRSKAGADFKAEDYATDDQAIQAAIDALPAGGGRVELSEGTFTLAATLTRAIANVTLEGQGNSTVLDYSAQTTGNCITVGGHNWHIRNMKIKGSASASAGALISSSSYSDGVVENIYFLNGFRGFYADTGIHWQVTDCHADACQDVGFWLGGALQYSVIVSCVAESCGDVGFVINTAAGSAGGHTIANCIATGNTGCGFLIRASSFNKIVGCLSYANAAQGFVIDLGADANLAQYNIIANCVSRNNTGVAGEGITVFASDGTGCEYNTIIGNVCVGNATNQIEIWNSGGYCRVEGNYCEGGSAVGLNGIYIGDSSNGSPQTVVTGNTCRGNYENGILVDDSVECVITNNICVDNHQRPSGSGSTRQNGITLTGTATDALITGNLCTNDVGTTQEYGIQLENSATAFISNNRLGGNNTGALQDSVGSSTVRDNLGWITEKSGIATLVNGQTSIVVTHGLAVTPVAGDIMVTPMESLGAASEFYIDTYTSTQFRIRVDIDPTQDVDFAWKAVVL